MGSLPEPLLCAVDGGGSGCRVVIARRGGAILARVDGGAANVASDPDGAIANLQAAIAAAARLAGLGAGDLARCVAHAGLAGVLDERGAAAVAARLPFAQCGVSDDRATSAAGALGTRDGVVLSVGTGSFAAARRGDDVLYLGGWGLVLGDQASGAWLGRAALGHALLAHDGIEPHGELTRAILARFGGAPAPMVAFARDAAPRDFAAFAPGVADASAAGDAAGLALMRRGAGYLQACVDRAGLTDGDVVCLMGGLGPRYAPFLEGWVRARVRPPQGDALDGALLLARRRSRRVEAAA